MTIGDFPQSTCPNCGYCPHCGRGGYRIYPYQPWYPSWPTGPTWYGGTASDTFTGRPINTVTPT